MLAVYVFLSGSPAASAEPPPNPDPPPVHLEAGDPAPFAGDLLTIERSLRLGLGLDDCERRAGLELRHATDIFEIEIQRERDNAEAMVEAERRRRAAMMGELERARAWYRSPEFVAVVAVVGALSLMFGAAALMGAVGG